MQLIQALFMNNLVQNDNTDIRNQRGRLRTTSCIWKKIKNKKFFRNPVGDLVPKKLDRAISRN